MDCLLFDFGGTLDSDGLTWLDRFRRIYKEEGVADDAKLERAFYNSDDHLGERHALAGKSLAETVHLQVSDVVSVVAPDRPELVERVSERFLAGCREHFDRNKPVLRRLSKTYKLGIVSNWYGNLESVLASEGLRQYFGSIADSGVVGVIKPEPKIFQHALTALRASAASSLFVGDSLKRDMRGAEALKMRHAFLSPSGEACCERALRLTSFVELEHLLELEGMLA